MAAPGTETPMLLRSRRAGLLHHRRHKIGTPKYSRKPPPQPPHPRRDPCRYRLLYDPFPVGRCRCLDRRTHRTPSSFPQNIAARRMFAGPNPMRSWPPQASLRQGNGLQRQRSRRFVAGGILRSVPPTSRHAMHLEGSQAQFDVAIRRAIVE